MTNNALYCFAYSCSNNTLFKYWHILFAEWALCCAVSSYRMLWLLSFLMILSNSYWIKLLQCPSFTIIVRLPVCNRNSLDAKPLCRASLWRVQCGGKLCLNSCVHTNSTDCVCHNIGHVGMYLTHSILWYVQFYVVQLPFTPHQLNRKYLWTCE